MELQRRKTEDQNFKETTKIKLLRVKMTNNEDICRERDMVWHAGMCKVT